VLVENPRINRKSIRSRWWQVGVIEVDQFEGRFNVVTEREFDTTVDPDAGKFVFARDQAIVVGWTKARFDVRAVGIGVESKEVAGSKKVT